MPGSKLSMKIIESVFSHVTNYLEDDDHKPVDFNGETISFTCQLLKKWLQMNFQTQRGSCKIQLAMSGHF